MSNRTSTVTIVVGVAFAGIMLLSLFCRGDSNDKSDPKGMSLHSRYAHYDFVGNDRVIRLGTQPLYIPTGLISEAMKRDIILQKALSEMGMEIRFYPFLKGNDVNFFLKRGDLDAGIGGDMPALTAASTSNIAVTNLVQQGFTSIVTRKYILVRELRGKRIGYALGSNAHYSLLQALAGADLNEKDVRLVPMDVSGMPKALQAGSIDAFSAWEPTPSIALKDCENAMIMHRNLSSGYMYFEGSFSAEHQEAVICIAASAIRAIRWMQLDNENLITACSWSKRAAEELTGDHLGISAKEIAGLAKKDIIGMRQPFRIPDSSLRAGSSLHGEFQFLKTLGIIPASSDWSNVQSSFDKSVVDRILANPRQHKLNKYKYLGEGGRDE